MESIAKKHLDHKILKQNAAERAEQALTLAYNGGLFKVTPELIVFTTICFQKYEHQYLKDMYGNPVQFDSAQWQDFSERLREKYNEVMNDWHNEFNEIRKVRKSEQL